MSVTTTTLEHREIHAITHARYDKQCPASARILHVDGRFQGLFIAVPDLQKQFAVNITSGLDICGDLFYNEAEDLEEVSQFNIFHNIGQGIHGEGAVVIQFFSAGMDNGYYAQFVGKLNKGVEHEGNELVDGETSAISAAWTDLVIGTTSATVTKRADINQLTIEMLPIGRKVSFAVPRNAPQGNISMVGSLSFKSLRHLNHGAVNIVDYNAQRIAFYDFNDIHNQIAYFTRVLIDALQAKLLLTFIPAHKTSIPEDSDDDDEEPFIPFDATFTRATWTEIDLA